MSTSLLILYFAPHLYMEAIVKPLEAADAVKEQERELIHPGDVEKEKRVVMRGSPVTGPRGINYLLYQFHKLRQLDPFQDNSTMVNEDDELTYLSSRETFNLHDIPNWFDRRRDYCGGCFIVYGQGKQVVSLKNVTINPRFAHGKVGGENIEEVINQKVEHETILLEKGYFVLDTKSKFDVKEPLSHDLKLFMSALVTKDSSSEPFLGRKRPDMMSVITIRHEYANFYHTTMNWYDIFLIMVLFKIDPYHLEVIWMDGHPRSQLDSAWEKLYGHPIRAASITDPVTYNKMIWNGFGAKSHVNIHKADFLPFVEAFRHFVLNRFEIPDNHAIKCHELRITIIWRRDYVAHPRNPSGHVARQIANEEEVWKAAKEADYRAIVNGVQLDRLDFEAQLKLIVNTDILIGLHGAALSHILYLPSTSGVIELFPFYVSAGNAHFQAMAKWRRLPYMTWCNTDKSLEKKNHKTEIPTNLLKEMIKEMRKQICNE